MADKRVYICTALTGGTSGALDALPYNSLQDGELAFTITSSYTYVHIFDATSSSSESSPDVIAPDDVGSNTGRWLLRLSFVEPLYVDRTNTRVGIGTTSPDRLCHIELSDTTVSAVSYPLRLTHVTTGTPAVGIGAGIEFEIHTAGSNYEVGATIEAVATDVTDGSEDFDLVFKLMTGGAAVAEKVRFTSAGDIDAVSFGGIAKANLVDKTAAENITGAWTFDTDVLVIDPTNDRVGFKVSSPEEVVHASGKGYFTEGVRVRQDVDDYGGNFTNYTPPTGANGLIILAEDTNATNPGQRLYAYINGNWRYVDLT